MPKLGSRCFAQAGGRLVEEEDLWGCGNCSGDPNEPLGRMREFIDRVFRKYLTPRERKILHLYYGLEQGSDAMTLEKIGALMGVTRERIRQIRERAFEKLRESPDGAALSGFWTAD